MAPKVPVKESDKQSPDRRDKPNKPDISKNLTEEQVEQQEKKKSKKKFDKKEQFEKLAKKDIDRSGLYHGKPDQAPVVGPCGDGKNAD